MNGARTQCGSPDGRISIAIDLPEGILDTEVHAIREEMRQCMVGLRSIVRVTDAVVEQRRESTRDTQ